MQITIRQHSYSDPHGYYREHTLTGTGIADVDTTGDVAGKALVDLKPIQREAEIAQGHPERVTAEATVAAQEAGRSGAKFDKKAWTRKKRAADENAEEARLDLEVALSFVRASLERHRAAIEANAAALSAAAEAQATLALTSLATASRMTRAAGAGLDGSLTVYAAVERLLATGDFTPIPPRARNTHGDFEIGGAPMPYIQLAQENLGLAMDRGSTILEETKTDAKTRRTTLPFDDEGDEIDPDEVEYTPDADDDDDSVADISPGEVPYVDEDADEVAL